MNKLQHETSPYLLQHADNPVDWHAWRPEALDRAQKEDKPLLVSIGYSTCHWCHVMERESFEDKAVAEFMNTHFINIKVDREERPDLDQIYMEACQVMTGAGGWPLNVFCTPDGKPFYAGTYFPPRAAYNRPSWMQVLQRMQRTYQDRRDVVEDQANRLLEYIAGASRKLLDLGPEATEAPGPTTEDLQSITESLMKQADQQHGGFGGAPKFPQVSNLRFLLRAAHDLNLSESKSHVHTSVQKMIYGGIYDQIGGGFMRYATDQAWLVPHFEKMLYDNAGLLTLLAECQQQHPDSLYLRTVKQTLGFIDREMTGPRGGFYSALDADSEGKEGAFYVWSWNELADVLGEDLHWVADYYGLKPEGNWEGTNILWRPRNDAAFLEKHPALREGCSERLAAVEERLMQARSARVRPGLDDKYLLDWNAMMLGALAKIYRATGLEKARELALRNLEFLRHTFGEAGPEQLQHAFTDRSEDGASFRAYLDDYAYYIQALLAVYEINWDTECLREAERYTDYLLNHYLDTESDLFYFTAEEARDVPVRRHEIFDSSTPSGNSVMARNLLRLSILLERPAYRELAGRMLQRAVASVKKYPGALANWGIALAEYIYPPREIAIVGPDAHARAASVLRSWDPHRVVMAAANIDSETMDAFPLLKGRAVADKSTLIYLCENYACRKPVETVEELAELLGDR